jgi:hypothetical protein
MDHAHAVAVGSRQIATATVLAAIRNGTWVVGEVDGARMIRHRDWTAPAAAQPAAEGSTPDEPFTVPTLEELHGLARLLTATDWERAAIVAAHVERGAQHVSRGREAKSSLLTPRGFAALGINGLASKDTVRRYVEAWASTGLPRPTPGAPVALPTGPFPASTGQSRQTRRRTQLEAADINRTYEVLLDLHDDDQLLRLVARLQVELLDRRRDRLQVV